MLSEYKTKTEIINRTFPGINGNNQFKSTVVVAIDGGYSSVKGISKNKAFCFSSFCLPAPDDFEIIGEMKDNDILFRDNKTDAIWLIGATAEHLLDSKSIDQTADSTLFERYRYNSTEYKTIMLAGIGVALAGNNFSSDKKLLLQTGLPSTYKDTDTNKLKTALTGDYDISVKIGKSSWESFSFSLNKDNIAVMEQPQGTLVASAFGKDGKGILTSRGTLILDVGFGTEDIFSVRAGFKNSHATYRDTGMRAVFAETIASLKKTNPELSLQVFELQTYLERGEIILFDRETLQTTKIPFEKELEEVNDRLTKTSVQRLLREYGDLLNYEYLIVTGGTGESRYEKIKNMLSGLQHLKVIPANINYPNLSCIYSNVIGYYLYAVTNVNKE